MCVITQECHSSLCEGRFLILNGPSVRVIPVLALGAVCATLLMGTRYFRVVVHSLPSLLPCHSGLVLSALGFAAGFPHQPPALPGWSCSWHFLELVATCSQNKNVFGPPILSACQDWVPVMAPLHDATRLCHLLSMNCGHVTASCLSLNSS